MFQVVHKTKVAGHYLDLMKRFDRDLFEALAPKVGKIEIAKFTGSETGDKVHIKFLSPIRTEWVSHIIDHGQNENKAYFIDKGVQLPFPLDAWEHHHVIEKISEEESYIVDDMRFKGRNYFWSLILYPTIYLGFLPRGKVYRSYFGTFH